MREERTGRGDHGSVLEERHTELDGRAATYYGSPSFLYRALSFIPDAYACACAGAGGQMRVHIYVGKVIIQPR